MSNQLQRKTSPSLWDKLLFAQQFEFAVDMLLHDCLDRLSNLSQPQTGFLNPSRRTVEVQEMDTDAYSFEIHLQRYSRGFIDFTNAKCVGFVFMDQDSKKTIVEGKITLGMMILPLYISLVAIFFASLSSPSLGWSLVLTVVGLLYGLQSWLDHRKLHRLLHDAFQVNEQHVVK
jgi:hypothetical protein